MSETAKIRHKVLPYLEGGRGLDLGCGWDKVTYDAIGVNQDWAGQGDRADFWFDLNLPIPSPDGIWDFVYSSHLLEHLLEPYRALKDWWAKIKPGGYLVLYMPHKELYLEPNPEHLNMWTTEELLVRVEALPGATILMGETEDPAVDGPDRYSFLIMAQKQG